MRQTLSAEEAQAVVKLQLESSGDASRVRVEDLAETLGISIEEVEILLERAQRGHAQAAQAQMEHHRQRDLRRVIVAFVCAVLIVAGGFGAYRLRESYIAREEDPTQDIDKALDLANHIAEREALRGVPPIPDPPEAKEVLEDAFKADALNSSPPVRMFFGKGDNPEQVAIEGLTMEDVARKVEDWAAKQRKPKARSVTADEATIRSLEEHDYNDPGLARPAITFENDGFSNELVLPIYSGTNPEVERKATAERWRVIGEGMHIDAPYPGP